MADGDSLRAECLFYSMGRIANVEGLQLEKAGVELDSQGNISANALFQTTSPHIYAAGDVIGPPSLASTSMEQGRLAVRNALLLLERRDREHDFEVESTGSPLDLGQMHAA